MAATHVSALRSTWRSTAEQYKAQAFRFLRLFVLTLGPQLAQQYLSTGHLPHLNRAFITAVVVPALEVVWRQLHPALTASQVDTAPGAAIIPTEVGLPAAPASVPAAVESPAEEVDLSGIPADITD